MPRKLKVFRTPTGFHDAYVAAPSRAAALKAWGSDADLFARGVAEEITDPKLMEKPLARPGEVIKLSRGDLASQLKVLGPGKRNAAAAKPEKPARKAKPKPPPSRAKVEAAEAALAKAHRRHAEGAKALERQLAALHARQDKETARLTQARDKAREAYRAALEKWSEA